MSFFVFKLLMTFESFPFRTTAPIDFFCSLLTLFYYLLGSLCTLSLSELCAFSVHCVPVLFLRPRPYWISLLVCFEFVFVLWFSLWRSPDFTPGMAFFSFFLSFRSVTGAAQQEFALPTVSEVKINKQIKKNKKKSPVLSVAGRRYKMNCSSSSVIVTSIPGWLGQAGGGGAGRRQESARLWGCWKSTMGTGSEETRLAFLSPPFLTWYWMGREQSLFFGGITVSDSLDG